MRQSVRTQKKKAKNQNCNSDACHVTGEGCDKGGMNAQPTLCLFVRDFLRLPLAEGPGGAAGLLRVPNAAVPATPWAELHGRVVAAAPDVGARPFCFAVDDGTAVCECVWFAPPGTTTTTPTADVVPRVGAFVLCRGTLRTGRTRERQLSVRAVRALSPAGDHLLLARADREAMRVRYGLV